MVIHVKGLEEKKLWTSKKYFHYLMQIDLLPFCFLHTGPLDYFSRGHANDFCWRELFISYSIFISPYIKQSKYSFNAIELLVPCAFLTVLSFRHITGFKHSKNSVKTTYIALNNNVVQSFMFIFSFKKGKQFHDILTNGNRPNIKRMA